MDEEVKVNVGLIAAIVLVVLEESKIRRKSI